MFFRFRFTARQDPLFQMLQGRFGRLVRGLKKWICVAAWAEILGAVGWVGETAVGWLESHP